LALAVMVALALQLSVAAVANPQNENKPAPAKKARKPKKKASGGTASIPTGTQNCLNRLATLAAQEPLPSYAGAPEPIINNGMLWNDPKAKCAATDQAQREKLSDLATAWHQKDAAKVRSTLQELGAAAEETPAPAMKPKPHRKAKKSAGAANKNG